jgi:diaminopimelate epimerase
MRFAKYHGTGNDFVMVEDLDDELELSEAAIAAICDRHRGVGADGVIRIVRGDGVDFFMDYANADGHAAEMCGNGIRCLAKYAFDRGLATATELDVATRAGVMHLLLSVAGGRVEEVTVDMGAPALQRKAIPMAGDPEGTFLGQTIEADGRAFEASAVSMGNPHCVLFLDEGEDLASMDVPGIGSLVEHFDEFPAGTNVEFVTVRNGSIHMRVWERGSGETLACGTGACAALVASALAELVGRATEVVVPGGRLRIDWRADDHVFMTGPATWVFDGELPQVWLAAAGGSR